MATISKMDAISIQNEAKYLCFIIVLLTTEQDLNFNVLDHLQYTFSTSKWTIEE